MSSRGLRARVGRQAALYGLGVVLGRALSFFSLPIITQLLTPADYGVISLIEMTFDVLTIIAGSRIAQGVFHFYHKANEPADKRAVLSTSLILLFITFSCVATVAWFSAPALSRLLFNTEEYATVIRIASLSFPWQGLLGIPLDYLRLRDSAGVYVSVGFSKSLLQLTLIYVFLAIFGMGIEGVFLSTLVAQSLIGIGLVVWLVRSVGLRYSVSTGRDLFRFGMPLVLTQIATFFTTFGDRYFLQAHTDEATVGIYALAYNFGFLLFSLGYAPFGMVWDPVRFEVARREDPDRVFARAFIHMNILLFTIALAIALFVGDFLRIISDPDFWGASAFVPVILAAYVLQAWTSFHEIGILVKEQTRFVTISNWTAALTAALAYTFLIPTMGGWGAALGTFVAFAIRSVMTYRFAQRLWPLELEWTPVLKIVGLATAAVIVEILLPEMRLVPSIGVRLLIGLAFLAGIWKSGVIPAEERELVERFAREPRLALRQIADVMRARPVNSG